MRLFRIDFGGGACSADAGDHANSTTKTATLFIIFNSHFRRFLVNILFVFNIMDLSCLCVCLSALMSSYPSVRVSGIVQKISSEPLNLLQPN